jgi:hypothetical protein
MARQLINIGTGPNTGTGTPLRESFDRINQNFEELYGASTIDTKLQIVEFGIEATEPNTDINLSTTGSGATSISKLRLGNTRTIDDPIGAVGDKEGDVAWDSNFFYVCINNYDGISNIWRRTPLDAWGI